MAASSTGLQGETLEPTWGDTLGCLWTALSCWFMGWIFLTTWRHPERIEDGRWVQLGVGVMVLEFILVHSGGVMHHLIEEKAGLKRPWRIAGLVALYSVFGLGIALGFRSWWLLGSFALVMSGRLHSLFTGHTKMDLALGRRRMVASVCLYLGLLFATLFLPIPAGGITSDMLDSSFSRGGGEWVDHPEKAIAMGTFYFFLLGLVEMRPPRALMPLQVTNRKR